jgi:hypothetical protein
MPLLRAAEMMSRSPRPPLPRAAEGAAPDHALRGRFPLIDSLDLPGNRLLGAAFIPEARPVEPPEAGAPPLPAPPPPCAPPPPPVLAAGAVSLPLSELFHLLGATGAAAEEGFAALRPPADPRS